MTAALQVDDARKVDERRRSFTNSQPRTTRLLAYRGITCERWLYCGVGVEQFVGTTGVEGLNVEIHPA